MIYADSARQLGGAADRLNCCGNGFHARKVGISNIAPSTGLLGIATHAAADFGTDTKMNAGEVIRTLRKARGISQSALAAEIGWERGTIAAVEAGHDRPGAELVEALATFFQTSTDHILGRDGTRQQ
jgi:DNA-binding XRE family transcriptional regulator